MGEEEIEMENKLAVELFNKGILCKGAKVKSKDLYFLHEFGEVERAFITEGVLVEDWVILVIDGKYVDATFITEIEGYELPAENKDEWWRGELKC